MKTTHEALQALVKGYEAGTNIEDIFDTLTIGQVIGVHNTFGMPHGITIHLGLKNMISEIEIGGVKTQNKMFAKDNSEQTNNDTLVSNLDYHNNIILLEALVKIIEYDNELKDDESEHFKFIY